MAIGEITIGIPGVSSTTFASSPITAIALSEAGEDAPLSSRAAFGFDSAGEPSIWGTTPIQGGAWAPRFIWTLAPWVSRDQADQIYALALYQKQAGGALRLIDEIDPVVYQTGYNSRVLLAETTPSWGANNRKGYGVFSIQLQLDGDWDQYLGLWADDLQQARQLTFTAVEV